MKDQIEKLKNDLEQCHREFVTDGDVYTDYAVTAKGLIEKGWRKQSEGEWLEKVRVSKEGKPLLRHYKCNLCGVYLATQANFCPECGAHMKGENK